MARNLSGEASLEENELFQQLLQNDPAVQQEYDILKRVWHAGEEDDYHNEITADDREDLIKILQLAAVEGAIDGDVNEKNSYTRARGRRNIRRRTIVLVPVTFTVICIVLVAVFKKKGTANEIQPASPQVVAAQNGSRSRTILPDGSTVWLNAGSKISYEGDFTGTTRDVSLEGEAYFDVVKNPQRPFIVHTSGIDIKVLGTIFNVRSYPNDKTVETTLLRGLVQVTRESDPKQKPIFLHPDQKLIIQKTLLIEQQPLPLNGAKALLKNKIYVIADLDTAVKENERIETAWVYDRLEFRGENFEMLADKLERWYNVNVVFEDDAVKQLTFNGSFEKETVDQAFTALKTAAPFNFSINGHEIRIRSLAEK